MLDGITFTTSDGSAMVADTRSHAARQLATFTVNPGSDTLQTALNSASNGDTLLLLDGTYTSTAGSTDPLPAVIDITKSITIRAQNSGLAVLDGEFARRVIKVASGATVILDGLKITQGEHIPPVNDYFYGGCNVYISHNDAHVTLNSCEIAKGCNCQGCHTIGTYGPGLLVDSGSAVLNSCSIHDNRGTGAVNAMTESSSVALTSCNIFNNNNVGNHGAGLSFSGGATGTVTSCNIYNNVCEGGGEGGGILTIFTETAVTITDSNIYSNSARRGGGLYAKGGGLVLRNTRFWNNDATCARRLFDQKARHLADSQPWILRGRRSRSLQS